MTVSNIAHQIAAAIDRHPCFTVTTIGPAIGKSRGYGTSLLGGKHDPSWTTVLKICQVLGVDPADLIEPMPTLDLRRSDPTTELVEKHAEALLNRITNSVVSKMSDRGVALTIDELVAWWHKNSGSLTAMGQFAENVDIYRRPDATTRMIEPHKLGANSLACQTLISNDHARLKQFLGTLTEAQIDQLTFSYKELSNGPKTDVSSLIVDMPDMDTPVRLNYCRCLLPVTDGQGNEYVLNYSRPFE